MHADVSQCLGKQKENLFQFNIKALCSSLGLPFYIFLVMKKVEIA